MIIRYPSACEMLRSIILTVIFTLSLCLCDESGKKDFHERLRDHVKVKGNPAIDPFGVSPEDNEEQLTVNVSVWSLFSYYLNEKDRKMGSSMSIEYDYNFPTLKWDPSEYGGIDHRYGSQGASIWSPILGPCESSEWETTNNDFDFRVNNTGMVSSHIDYWTINSTLDFDASLFQVSLHMKACINDGSPKQLQYTHFPYDSQLFSICLQIAAYVRYPMRLNVRMKEGQLTRFEASQSQSHDRIQIWNRKWEISPHVAFNSYDLVRGRNNIRRVRLTFRASRESFAFRWVATYSVVTVITAAHVLFQIVVWKFKRFAHHIYPYCQGMAILGFTLFFISNGTYQMPPIGQYIVAMMCVLTVSQWFVYKNHGLI